MTRPSPLLGLLVLLAAAGCTPPTGPTDFQIVSGFRVDPTFNAFTGPCEVRYTLAEPAVVQIRITQRQPDGSVAGRNGREKRGRVSTRGFSLEIETVDLPKPKIAFPFATGVLSLLVE